ncbi:MULTISPECIES: DMT family transporter [Paenibacillus]|uniref:QacE family quaternary ammonium compound efflux SMR transporter n=1 Tax=Paenibacillus campinasensis TaxID=66347 RepID=A0A268EHR5_9BACL|nr:MULTISPECIES: multidrug efflux SMR transporter [Paenibacillus]PAD72665.1 QacE family quaternary ammonium compound efflux SMR transporter [Paenibacillus campinasensis]PAK51117.1 QacE family quaternary ammonium compound efflux SMR transporter [Paenibacillus sp. 7541]
MTAWILLIIAGLLEIVWAIALKQSSGLTRLWPSIIGISTAGISLYLLTLALRSLPVGTAYAIWVGTGTLGVAIVGIIALGEKPSLQKFIFLALIFAGMVGLKMIEGNPEQNARQIANEQVQEKTFH